MANNNLNNARAAQNDEFYTQYGDVEKEMNSYLERDPNVFRDKIVLLPCDDPEWSNFTKYFAQNFERFGLNKLISTSYAGGAAARQGPTEFESRSPHFDPAKSASHGKMFVVQRDASGDGRINVGDLEWSYLEGDGDFRSEEVTRLRDEADIIITNPPFSLWRKFFAWIIEADKQFVIIGNMNAIQNKEVFPLIKADKMWLGATNFNTGMYFGVPEGFAYADSYKFEKERDGRKVSRVPAVCWYTNLDHGRRHEPLSLATMDRNLRFNAPLQKQLADKTNYEEYVNYDAIDVPVTSAIPSDYEGKMGVPITFLGKYSPEQFEILGSSLQLARPISDYAKEGTYMKGGPSFYVSERDGTYRRLYSRIVIRHRKSVE